MTKAEGEQIRISNEGKVKTTSEHPENDKRFRKGKSDKGEEELKPIESSVIIMRNINSGSPFLFHRGSNSLIRSVTSWS